MTAIIRATAVLACAAALYGTSPYAAPVAHASPRCDYNAFAGTWVATDTQPGGPKVFLGFCPGGILPGGGFGYGVQPNWPSSPGR